MGDVNLGPDKRPLGAIGGWIQSRLSFHSSTPPKFARLSLPSAGSIAASSPSFFSLIMPKGNGHYASFRAGWRWDVNWERGGYIADVIVKLNIDKEVLP